MFTNQTNRLQKQKQHQSETFDRNRRMIKLQRMGKNVNSELD